jgi:hypothetical protein
VQAAPPKSVTHLGELEEDREWKFISIFLQIMDLILSLRRAGSADLI